MSTSLFATFDNFTILLKRFLYYILYPLQKIFLESRIHRKIGTRNISYSDEELILFCLFRNGGIYLENFIQYHFSMGIKHIVFVDNGSTDNSFEIIKSYDNVSLYKTNLNFRKYESKIRNFLFNKFSKNRWGLCIDIDEFFDFPYSNKISLRDLLEYLNKFGYTALIAQMLDLFSKKPLPKMEGNDNQHFREKHIYYDLTKIKKINYKDHQIGRHNVLKNENIKFYTGGIRSKIFNLDVYLTKHPLIFNSRKVIPFTHPHKSIFINNADISAVIYHYKFLSNFFEFVTNAVEQSNYAHDSADYRAYLKVIETNKKINIFSEDSKMLKNVNQLIEDDFLSVSSEYLEWVKNHEIL